MNAANTKAFWGFIESERLRLLATPDHNSQFLKGRIEGQLDLLEQVGKIFAVYSLPSIAPQNVDLPLLS